MDNLFRMRRRWLLLLFVSAIFNVQGFAQIGLVVQLPPNANISNVAAHANGAVITALPEANQFLLSVPAVPNNLSDNEVRWMELNQGSRLPAAPHAAYLTVAASATSDWYKTQPSFTLIHLPAALTHATGRGVVIADINSQVDYSHPALVGHLTSGYDFVVDRPTGVTALNESSANYLDESSANYLDAATSSYLDESSANYLDESSANYLDSQNPAYNHGTLTAGILAAVAPEAMIMPLRAFDENGSSNTFTIARAIRYAVNHGAQVINMSFGTVADTAVLRTAIACALSHDVVLTASAGNRNTVTTQYPAAYANVLTTAATNLLDVKASFSNYGSPILVDAPGVNIISAVPGNLYGIVNGTSFSAPIVAGTAALIRSAGVIDVASRIAAGAVNIDGQNPGYVGQLGNGRVDILSSVNTH
jgi:subtilisin family serine protease